MKVEYLPADVDNLKGPRYILRPEKPEEQKFLSILRDILLGANYRIRMIGTENLDKDVPGLPPKPAIAASFTIETKDGKIPSEFVPSAKDKLDVNRYIHPSESSKSVVATGNMGSIKQYGRHGPSTVIEEQ